MEMAPSPPPPRFERRLSRVAYRAASLVAPNILFYDDILGGAGNTDKKQGKSQWEVVVSAVCCGVKHMSSLVVAEAAI